MAAQLRVERLKAEKVCQSLLVTIAADWKAGKLLAGVYSHFGRQEADFGKEVLILMAFLGKPKFAP
jgi:hypothetical protein